MHGAAVYPVVFAHCKVPALSAALCQVYRTGTANTLRPQALGGLSSSSTGLNNEKSIS